MATTTYYIRSHYDRDRDLERLQRETGQLAEGDEQQPELPEEDPWEKIQSFGVRRRLANAPRFVPATIAYDPWNEGLASLPEEPKASSGGSVGIADWYKSLTQSNITGDNTSTVETTQTATTPAPAPSQPIASSSSISAPISRPSSTHPRRTNSDWFISRALSAQTSTSSAPPTPIPTTSLADILLRDPPITSQPLKPPVFLHLGPSNKGWAMLQSRGWREGEGLGVGAIRRADTRVDELEEEEEDELEGRERKRAKRENRDSKQAKGKVKGKGREVNRVTVKEEEHVYEGDDGIIEVKKTEIIDLTLSDSESEFESDSDSENNTSEVDDDPTTAPSPSATITTTTSTPTTTAPQPPPSHHATQTSLLTPLPTVLKSDRLGIGLKAKTEGPYHSSVKRVTHNAAAMREHVKRGEETRRRKVMEGKGRRAFERRERKERERRREMLAYMNG